MVALFRIAPASTIAVGPVQGCHGAVRSGLRLGGLLFQMNHYMRNFAGVGGNAAAWLLHGLPSMSSISEPRAVSAQSRHWAELALAIS